MAYVVPTKTQFVTRFPRFRNVDDDAIAGALDEAKTRISVNWLEEDYTLALMLYTAHVLTLDGLGEGTEAQLNLGGMAGFQSITTGSLSITRASGVSLGLTSYGQRLLELKRRSFGGGAITTQGAV